MLFFNAASIPAMLSPSFSDNCECYIADLMA